MSDQTRPPTVLFAGGGTGGHIFPNIAIAQRLLEMRPDVDAHLIVSGRPVDARILLGGDWAFSTIDAQPAPRRPWHLPRFYRAWREAVQRTAAVIDRTHARALVATGGFVSAPAIAAARKRGVPIVMVNLDAVPGRANLLMAKKADVVFSVYDTPALPGAKRIGMPLRREAMAEVEPGEARAALGLASDLPTLLVTGASQGAQSINRMMAGLLDDAGTRAALDGWQVLHLTGQQDAGEIEATAKKLEGRYHLVQFCEQMGLAWAAADVAISRAGAGSVAEVWASATPAIFMPYPHHKDQHQTHNAQPTVDAGGAAMIADAIEPAANVDAITPLLLPLLESATKREAMAAKLRGSWPGNGAQAVAAWLGDRLG